MLDSLVLAALAKSPDKRTASAAIMRDQLEVVMRACEVEVRSSMVARWLAETGLDAIAVSEPARVETPVEIGAELASVLEPAVRDDELETVPAPSHTPTPFAWQARTPFKMPSLRSRAPVSWSRAAVLAAAIVVAPIALAARGKPSEPPHPAVAMTVTQIEPAPTVAVAPVAVQAIPVAAPQARTIEPPAAHGRRAPRVVRSEELAKPVEVAKSIEIAKPIEPVAIVASIAAPLPVIAATPVPVTVPRAAGPMMIRPDEVRRTSGAIERIDGRRVDRDGGPKKLSAVLCIDARGTVSSVKLLAPTPAWLGETLVRDLRAFTFTPYRSGAACFVRQLSID
jgi:hypothetical protein